MLKSIDNQLSHRTFPTEIKTHIIEAARLNQYLQKLQDKINYAKWKQQIILQFNYVSLKNIAEKITNEKLIYEKKVQLQYGQCNNVLSDPRFTDEMQQIRGFYHKLESKIKEIQLDIDQQHIRRAILQADILEKKSQLQNLIRQNKKLDSVKTINQKQIHQQQTNIKTFRSQSSKKPIKNSFFDKTITNRQSSILKVSGNTFSQSIRTYQKPLYFQCLQLIIASIRSMKSTEDVQKGIFLDVMSRKQQNNTAKFSMKSSICHTLIQNYAKRIKQAKKNSIKNDFDIDWETFQTFNWKQIMGVIMVKDRQSNCLKNILGDSYSY